MGRFEYFPANAARGVCVSLGGAEFKTCGIPDGQVIRPRCAKSSRLANERKNYAPWFSTAAPNQPLSGEKPVLGELRPPRKFRGGR